ncbi:MAG: hypothetical protein CME21_21460 [Gemmatimonadetes bacterium]|nr:hypothetical protein [Gemmatimonadota bacterium]|tara:strand:- start:12 stop:302 length:291 start_codon:yes stop_codon:yes gene_type:complete
MTEEFTVKIKDPIVAELVKLLIKRSNDGAVEYGFESLLERVDDPVALVSDALEEALDQIIYLKAALSILKEKERIAKEEEAEEDAFLNDLSDTFTP